MLAVTRFVLSAVCLDKALYYRHDKAEHIYQCGRVCKDVSATFFRCKHVFAVINDKLFKACEKNHKAHQTYDYLSNAHEGFIVFKSYRIRYG